MNLHKIPLICQFWFFCLFVCNHDTARRAFIYVRKIFYFKLSKHCTADGGITKYEQWTLFFVLASKSSLLLCSSMKDKLHYEKTARSLTHILFLTPLSYHTHTNTLINCLMHQHCKAISTTDKSGNLVLMGRFLQCTQRNLILPLSVHTTGIPINHYSCMIANMLIAFIMTYFHVHLKHIQFIYLIV